MSVTSVDTDYDDLTITVIADFNVTIDRVWELWSDPRKLERWLGPPTHPATIEKHELTPGGQIIFFMTGPDGDSSWGVWRITAVASPTALEFTDAFAEPGGTPVADMPASEVTVRLTESEGGTRMEMRSRFESREDMEQRLSMGEIEGLRQAIGQMDALLIARSG